MRPGTMKPLLPTLREKKRYLVFEVVSERKLAWEAVRSAVESGVLRHIGELGYARAGVQLLPEHWHAQSSRGMLRVSHTSLGEVRSSLGLVREAGGVPVIVRSVGASGILGRAVGRYLGAEAGQDASRHHLHQQHEQEG